MTGRTEQLLSMIDEGKRERSAIVSSHLRHTIAAQVRALRNQRGWTQPKMEELTGIKQSWISQVENPREGNPNLGTLIKLANAFDVGLLVRFVDFGTFLFYASASSPKELEVSAYEDAGLHAGRKSCLAEPSITWFQSSGAPLNLNFSIAPIHVDWDRGIILHSMMKPEPPDKSAEVICIDRSSALQAATSQIKKGRKAA